MGVYIEIRDTDNSIVGRLDVGNSNEFPLTLTRKLSDFNELNARSGVFSTDFEIPLTESNVSLLPSIYNANLKDTKQFFKKKDAIIYNDESLIARGKLRILSINTKEGTKFINCNFVGDNLSWVTEFSELALNEVNFADTIFNFDTTSVPASWTNTADDSDFVFAAIHRGGGATTYEPFRYEQFRPDLFVKRILTTSFNQVGYNVSSTFFDTSGFKSLILPYFGSNETNWVNTETTVNNYTISLTNSTAQALSNTSWESRDNGAGYSWTCQGSKNRIKLVTELSDANNVYNNSTYEFDNFPFGGNWDFEYTFNLTNIAIPFADANSTHEIYLTVESTGNNYAVNTLIHTFSGTTNQTINGNITAFVPDNATSKAYFWVKYKAINPTSSESWTDINDCSTNRLYSAMTISTSSKLIAKPNKVISAGSSISLADVLPRDFFVLDLVNDLTKMFNLYWRTNEANKTVYVEPRDDFFRDLTYATDYTEKIDLSKGYTLVDFKSIYPRYIDFNYIQDPVDGKLTNRNKIIRGRGGYDWFSVNDYDLGSDFEDGQTSITHSKISSTYYVDCGNYAPILAKMWSEDTASPTEFSTEFAPRILSYVYGTQKRFNNAGSRYLEYLNEQTNTIVQYTTIPYALGCNFTRNGITEAEVPIQLSYYNVGGEGLIKNYWSDSLQMIKDGKSLTINLVMSLNEFRDIDFREPIYFSAPNDLEGYWVFESINSVKIDNDTQSVKCNLVKKVNYEPINITTSNISDQTNQTTSFNVVLVPRGHKAELAAQTTILTNTTGDGI